MTWLAPIKGARPSHKQLRLNQSLSQIKKWIADELGVQNRRDLLPTHTTTGDQLISKMKKRQRLQ